jgi:adenylate cyclase
LREEQRRLAAILAADVAGYSRLMAADESGTLARLRRLRADVFEPKIAQFYGRIVGSAGDSLLVEFASAVNAVQCAIEVQRELYGWNASLPEDQRMAFRMAVNLGDVIAADGTIHGDSVNIAARLEKLAEPGGVCIGRTIYDQVKGKLAYAYDDLGEQPVHNIAERVHAYRVRLANSSAGGLRGWLATDALPLPDRPSIAVLPFANLSGDAEQEYFADGIVEEIITALSRFHWLFVIARSGNRVRIAGQLIDTSTDAHLWADRFDGTLEDIFDLQDQVTASVVGAIAPKLEQAEIERAKHKPTENLDAYDYFLRGMAAFHQWTREGNNEALQHFYRAIELDPKFASAYGMAARCYVQRKAGGWITDRAQEITETARLARRAAELGKDDAVALCTAGDALADVVGDLAAGVALTDRALVLNPNLAWALLFSGWAKIASGDPDAGLERIARALRLSPHDPQIFSMRAATAYAHFFAGRYAEAFSWAEMAVREQPSFLLSTCMAAASGALAGRSEEAEAAMARVRHLDPALCISNLKDFFPIRLPTHFATWADALRRAGLPE